MKKDVFLIKIDDAIAEINRFIDEFNIEITTYTSIHALQLIKNTFVVLRDNILSQHVDSRTLSRLQGISHHLCDQWPHNSLVGEKILDVCLSYKK